MKYKIEISPLADYYVVVIRDKDTLELKETFTLNESGADMIKLFCQGKDIAAVAQIIAAMYEVSIDSVKKDVEKFAEKLRKKGLFY